LAFANEIVFKRLDTAAVLGTWSYDDIAAGYESDSSRGCSELALTDRFTDPDDSTVKRGIATRWNGSPRLWTNLIASDGTTGPTYIVGADVNSSLGWFFGWLLPDTLDGAGNRQWWAQTGPQVNEGDFSHTFQRYDYCDTPGWKATWDGVHGPDALISDWQISPLSEYDADAEIFYFLLQNNQLRSAQVLRDYFICEPGEPCIVAANTGLYAWQHF
jgi:hypothetical protein